MRGRRTNPDDERLIRACISEREEMIAESNRLAKEAKKLSNAQLAKKFGVSLRTVFYISQRMKK